MASSEDFQSIYELYKTEGIPNGISIVNFCQQNGIVYSQFEKGYKFLQPVFEGNTVIYELDFKYLAALLECSVVKVISI